MSDQVSRLKKRTRKEETLSKREHVPSKRILYKAEPQLELLPDNIVIQVFQLLDAKSRIHLGRTCKRFWKMHRSAEIWKRIDLTPLGNRLKSVLLNKFVTRYFTSSLVELKLQTKAPIFTEAFVQKLLTKCPNIQRLWLEGVDFIQASSSTEWIAYSLPSLTCLYLTDCNLRFATLSSHVGSKDISIFPSLCNLSLQGCSRIDASDIQLICTLGRLESLRLSRLYRLDLDTLQCIVDKLAGLRELWIEDYNFTSVPIQSLNFGKMTELRSLSLARSIKSSFDVSAVAKKLSSQNSAATLRYLDVSGPKMEGGEVAGIITLLPQLHILRCSLLSDPMSACDITENSSNSCNTRIINV